MLSMQEKLQWGHPFNLFYTGNTVAPSELFQRNYYIRLKDIFCPSLGKPKAVLFITGELNFKWYLREINKMIDKHIDLAILYGSLEDKTQNCVNLDYGNVFIRQVKALNDLPTTTFAHDKIHHCNIGILIYEDCSLRVIVPTATLTSKDWNMYVHGVWVSPLCPVLSADKSDDEGNGVTKFKERLLQYIFDYQVKELDKYLKYIQRADFTKIKVCLVFQTAGYHQKTDVPSNCLKFDLQRLLQENCPAITNSSPKWTTILQVNSVGFMGESPNYWLLPQVISTLNTDAEGIHKVNVLSSTKIVFPSYANVRQNSYGLSAAETHSFWMDVSLRNQRWPLQYLYYWQTEFFGCPKLLPGLKSYCRISHCNEKMAWFLLSTANLSRSSWGTQLDNPICCKVYRWEIGVLFLPKFFDMEYFHLKTHDFSHEENKEGSEEENSKTEENEEKENYFPLIFDIPLVSYVGMGDIWESVTVRRERYLNRSEKFGK